MTHALVDIELKHLPLVWRGKVRNSFNLEGDRLLIVATDRISAFDVILPSPLPGKGAVLNRLSCLWFEWAQHIQPNHYLNTDLTSLPRSDDERTSLIGRSIIVQRASRIDVECVVRGYLAGSAWEEYRSTGTIHGERAPSGLRKGSKLPAPRFTPARKVDTGHDENISRSTLRQLVGSSLADTLEEQSLALYLRATEAAERAGFILADTKFEFGYVGERLTLIDEALTPDSSRYWDVRQVMVGNVPPAFDKQIVRDWLTDSGWNKQPPAPALPPAIIAETLRRYQDVERRIRSSMSNDGKVDDNA